MPGDASSRGRREGRLFLWAIPGSSAVLPLCFQNCGRISRRVHGVQGNGRNTSWQWPEGLPNFRTKWWLPGSCSRPRLALCFQRVSYLSFSFLSFSPPSVHSQHAPHLAVQSDYPWKFPLLSWLIKIPSHSYPTSSWSGLKIVSNRYVQIDRATHGVIIGDSIHSGIMRRVKSFGRNGFLMICF